MTMAWNQSLFLWLNATCAALPDWLWASLTITGHTSVAFALFGLFLLPKFKQPKVISGLFAAAILGGLDDKSFSSPASSKRLLITGTVIMGGVEIKN